jgi:hypothetical protein
VLGPPDTSGPDPEPTYPLTDEETGTTYGLTGGFVELEPYVGQRVTIEGVRIPSIDPLALNVTRIQHVDASPPPGPGPATSVTFDFELTVKGEPPAGSRLFGNFVPAESCISVPLANPDADGLYTGSLDVPMFPPGPVPPPGAEPVSLPVQIVQANAGAGPCNPTKVIKDFGTVPANDDTFRARTNFKHDGGDTTNPEVTTLGTTTPGSGSGGSGVTKVLPRTGGALPTLIVVGALLVAGGLLIRRAAR